CSILPPPYSFPQRYNVCIVISVSLQACGVVFPFATLTSICRSIVTICSGLYLLIGMASFSSKWILFHSTWYKFRRSRHLEALADQHPLVSEPLTTIAVSVRNTATLLEVLVATKGPK